MHKRLWQNNIMKLYINFLLLILLSSSNIHADVKYYASLDPLTDEKIDYVYGESVNNEFLIRPAYFKITYLKESDEIFSAFNSGYIDFAYDENDTVEMQYRFDKEEMVTLDLYFCSSFDESIENCRVKQSERNPSSGYFAHEEDAFIFLFDMFIWDDDMPSERKKLLIRFPGEEPIEFNLKGSVNAFCKLEELILEELIDAEPTCLE